MHPNPQLATPWERYCMALDEIHTRLDRITGALTAHGVSYALVGGQAVAQCVTTKDPAAVRITKDVDVLIRRQDLSKARAAALTIQLDYFETVGVGMFLERTDPSARKAVRLIWSGELVRPEHVLPASQVEESVSLPTGKQVVSLAGLVRMKLNAFRDQDRVHLRDMIDIDLVGREHLAGLPPELAGRLDELLTEMGR